MDAVSTACVTISTVSAASEWRVTVPAQFNLSDDMDAIGPPTKIVKLGLTVALFKSDTAFAM
jgi:hypothetical protein